MSCCSDFMLLLPLAYQGTTEGLQTIPAWGASFIAFCFGAIVGSFLNVCIHRMPRGHSIVHPGSKCYSCEKPVCWYDNVPLLSYILLRGKCRHCGAKFSIRYWLVELLTAFMFLWIWNAYGVSTAVVYAIFISGLIVASFIDFEHLIIPNEITLGGVVVGVFLCGVIPSLQNETTHFMGAVKALGGAAAGYFSLWAVVEFGKRVFGIKKLALPEPQEVNLTAEGIQIGTEDRELWEDIFSRESDVMSFDASNIRSGEKVWEKALIRVGVEKVQIGDESWNIDEMKEIKASAQTFYIPREAMGFGDVKFLAAIGAFLGPTAIFFVVLASSLLGSMVGLTTMMIGKKEWGMKLPYGPYLALAAILWLMWGARFTEFYFNLMSQ